MMVVSAAYSLVPMMIILEDDAIIPLLEFSIIVVLPNEIELMRTLKTDKKPVTGLV
jgi:hypothetical protein